MKRKVGELFNKPIVQGNENVLSSNEILVEQKGNTFSLKERVNGEIKEVSGGSSASGEGGGQLEGEYFLAKPNGRYWKSKLARMTRDKYPAVMGYKREFTDAQIESLNLYYSLIGCCSFSAVGDYGGIPSSGLDILSCGTIAVVSRAMKDINRIENATSETYLCLIGACQECDNIISTPDKMGISINGIVGLMRLTGEGAFDEMSDDEILAVASEMFMIEQVTKEEYESWYKW